MTRAEEQQFICQLEIMMQCEGSKIHKIRLVYNKYCYLIEEGMTDGYSDVTVYIPYGVTDTRKIAAEGKPYGLLSSRGLTNINRLKVICSSEDLTSLNSLCNSVRIRYLDLSDVNLDNITCTGAMFANSIIEDVEDKENEMWAGNLEWTSRCKKLRDISEMFKSTDANELDLNKLYTDNVTDMSGLFIYYKGTFKGTFNTENVIDTSRMFSFTSFDELDLTWMKLPKLKSAENMFYKCNCKDLKIGEWNTAVLRRTIKMFSRFVGSISGIEKLKFDYVVEAAYMFAECKLTCNIKLNWDMKRLRDMRNMIWLCGIETLDLTDVSGCGKSGGMKNITELCNNANIKTILVNADNIDKGEYDIIISSLMGITTADIVLVDNAKEGGV